MSGFRQTRRGITLLELLVIMSIISLLAALTVGAVFRAKEAQEKTQTENTLRKLASTLDVHWKAVIDLAKKEYDSLPSEIKQNLIALADNNPATPNPNARRDDRARLLYVKFRLKQEFPVSFAQVPNPGLSGSSYFLRPNGALTGKPAYIKVVNGLPAMPEKESAGLLVLALESPRAGVPSTGIEQIVGSTFLRNENGFRYLVDAWGNPLQFFVFPTASGPSTTDLDSASDPQDPEGLLKPQALSKWIAAPAFANLLHPQSLRRLVPVIASAGPDGDLGGNPAATNNFMDLPGAGSFDNLYSYRLRQAGARGD